MVGYCICISYSKQLCSIRLNIHFVYVVVVTLIVFLLLPNAVVKLHITLTEKKTKRLMLI